MELALPHVVVRVCGPGVGPDLVAALSMHPVEVTEARDAWEMNRVAGERPAILVVVVDPADPHSATVETWADFPGVPILIVSGSDRPFLPSGNPPPGWVDTVHSGQPVEDICWLVLEAVSRAAAVPGIAEHPLGPSLIEVDHNGTVLPSSVATKAASFFRLRPGDALLSLIDPLERTAVSHALEQPHAGESQFRTVRLRDDSGRRHIVTLGLRKFPDGRIAVLAQPLICGGTVVGHHVNIRDPITGLLSRWAMSRAIEDAETKRGRSERTAVVLLTLDDFAAIGSYIGHAQTDDVLMSVASAMHQVFPHPSLTSRLMGDTFLASMPRAEDDETVRRAERLLELLGRIDVPGFAPRFSLRASLGVAWVTDGDPDLAIRLAEAAAAEARAAGGNRVIVAGSARFSTVQARQLTEAMDLGSWEVWLQPVAGRGHDRVEYHEAVARFDGAHRHIASRADFFIAGRASGLLERFDQMMLQRVLGLLESHPNATISVNVTYETFVSDQFPGSFLDRIRRVPEGCGRVILEIAPRCVSAPESIVRPRLESLAAAGVAVALDDFGSGICRLRSLTQWPLAIVKLDQLVTGYVDDDPLQRDFVRTVVSLCRARGITTVAEYTRTAEQLARLVDDGVDLFQGELFGMPRPAAEALAASAVEAAPA